MSAEAVFQRRLSERVVRRQARVLRKNATLAERMLWERLRGGKCDGHKVRRQHPIGSFIADFCIVEKRLVIEIDGEVHATQAERDAERSRILQAAGYQVIRFANAQVETDIERVLNELRACIAQQR
jgi:leucyl-tRNA synthetase